MSKRILSYDQATKTKTIHHYDAQTDTTHIETVQDVSSIIDRNKNLQNEGSWQARAKKQEFVHIATIPNNVIVMLKQKHGIDVFNNDDLPKLERLLMSNEFKYLRTVDRI